MPYQLIDKNGKPSLLTGFSNKGNAMAELRAFQKADPKSGWTLRFTPSPKGRHRKLPSEVIE